MNQKEIVELMGIDYSAVSVARKRLSILKEQDRHLSAGIEEEIAANSRIKILLPSNLKKRLGELLFHLHPEPGCQDWVYRTPRPCFFILFDQVQFLQLPGRVLDSSH